MKFLNWKRIALIKLALLKKWRAAFIRANVMFRKMQHSAAYWNRRRHHALNLMRKAKAVASYRHRMMRRARAHMVSAIAARARAQARLRMAIKLRLHWVRKAKAAHVAMRAAKHLMNVAARRRHHAHAHWLRERKQKAINWVRYLRAERAYAIALHEARRRFQKQAVYLR